MKTRIYVGISGSKREVFRSPIVPNKTTHGHLYLAVIGPFRTNKGARFMAECGGSNPHVQHVRDAERLARNQDVPNFLKKFDEVQKRTAKSKLQLP